MKKLQTRLNGENLVRFLNIQQNIQTAQRRASRRGAPDNPERVFYEDILPFGGSIKHLEGSLTLSLSSESGESPEYPSNDHRGLEVHRKAELGLGYRGVREESSDWMLDELEITTKAKAEKNKLSRATESSQCKNLRTGSIPSVEENQEPENQNLREIDMRLYDEISQEEEQEIYNEICNRYGEESGRRYLLIRSLSAPEKKIEAWTTTKGKLPKPQIYSEKMMKCPISEMQHKGNIICSEISEDVRKKMGTLVETMPFCSTERIQEPKRWKDVMAGKTDRKRHTMTHVSIKGESDSTIFSSEEKSDQTTCLCGAFHCDCDLIKVACEVPRIKKICDMSEYKVDEINNYLITCRENLQNKQNQNRRVTVLQQHAENVANRSTKESVYLQATHDQTENELVTCLMKVMPPQGQEVSDTGFNYVQELANAISEHKMINEHEWRIWRYTQAKMENVENSDELDSLDSDIVESTTSDDGLSDCNIKSSKGLQPSRIPYFNETFELANTLFDKIKAKMEKTVSKNHDRQKMLMRKPRTLLLKEKFNLLQNDNRIFSQLCKEFQASDYLKKHFVPFSEKKRRKRARANAMKAEVNRKQNQRQMTEGLQLGKRYRKPKRSFLFTQKENYRGFSPRKQKFLLKKGDDKFRKCNLVGSDLCGRRLTQKVIHKDYRLIRRMFDDQLDRNKESLWDVGMKARMEEYMRGFKEQNRSAPFEMEEEEEVEEGASEVHLDTNQRRPKKDEQKIQTAQPYSWSYCTRSSGNAAGTIASMIRSLRSDAISHSFLASGNRDNTSTFLGAGGTASSFETSTVQTSSLEPVRRPGHLGGPGQVPSSKTPPKRHPYIPGKRSSFHMSDMDSTVIQTNHKKRLNTPGKHFAKSNKTLPLAQSIKTNVTNHSQKYPTWKSSKTVR